MRTYLPIQSVFVDLRILPEQALLLAARLQESDRTALDARAARDDDAPEPKVMTSPSTSRVASVTLPDMHGNTLLMLQRLHHACVITLNAPQYTQLKNLYINHNLLMVQYRCIRYLLLSLLLQEKKEHIDSPALPETLKTELRELKKLSDTERTTQLKTEKEALDADQQALEAGQQALEADREALAAAKEALAAAQEALKKLQNLSDGTLESQKLAEKLAALANSICKNVTEFTGIIDSIDKVDPRIFVRFLGDMLAERGNQDGFTLYLLNHLKKHNAQYEIIFSNHDVEFLKKYYGRGGESCITMRAQYRSFYALHALFEIMAWKSTSVPPRDVQPAVLSCVNDFSKATLDTVLETAYWPCFKLLSCELTDNESLVIYAHGRIDQSVIEAAEHKFVSGQTKTSSLHVVCEASCDLETRRDQPVSHPAPALATDSATADLQQSKLVLLTPERIEAINNAVFPVSQLSSQTAQQKGQTITDMMQRIADDITLNTVCRDRLHPQFPLSDCAWSGVDIKRGLSPDSILHIVHGHVSTADRFSHPQYCNLDCTDVGKTPNHTFHARYPFYATGYYGVGYRPAAVTADNPRKHFPIEGCEEVSDTQSVATAEEQTLASSEYESQISSSRRGASAHNVSTFASDIFRNLFKIGELSFIDYLKKLTQDAWKTICEQAFQGGRLTDKSITQLQTYLQSQEARLGGLPQYFADNRLLTPQYAESLCQKLAQSFLTSQLQLTPTHAENLIQSFTQKMYSVNPPEMACINSQSSQLLSVFGCMGQNPSYRLLNVNDSIVFQKHGDSITMQVCTAVCLETPTERNSAPPEPAPVVGKVTVHFKVNCGASGATPVFAQDHAATQYQGDCIQDLCRDDDFQVRNGRASFSLPYVTACMVAYNQPILPSGDPNAAVAAPLQALKTLTVEQIVVLKTLATQDNKPLVLTGLSFSKMNFHKADFRDVHFKNCDLSNANLSECTLKGADLRGADLRGADLRGADLRGADLRGANLSRANLSGCNLSFCVVQNLMIDCETKIDLTTQLPNVIMRERGMPIQIYTPALQVPLNSVPERTDLSPLAAIAHARAKPEGEVDRALQCAQFTSIKEIVEKGNADTKTQFCQAFIKKYDEIYQADSFKKFRGNLLVRLSEKDTNGQFKEIFEHLKHNPFGRAAKALHNLLQEQKNNVLFKQNVAEEAVAAPKQNAGAIQKLTQYIQDKQSTHLFGCFRNVADKRNAAVKLKLYLQTGHEVDFSKDELRALQEPGARLGAIYRGIVTDKDNTQVAEYMMRCTNAVWTKPRDDRPKPA